MSDYTPEGLRRVAGVPPLDGESWDNEWVIAQIRAHAAALEELAALREQLAERDAEIVALKAERDTSVAVTERIKVVLRRRGTDTSYVEWASYCRDALDRAERAEAALAAERERADRNEQDAERWRFARDDYKNFAIMQNIGHDWTRLEPSEANAAIDAARRP